MMVLHIQDEDAEVEERVSRKGRVSKRRRGIESFRIVDLAVLRL